MSASRETKTEWLPTLNGWRAIAILAVLTIHSTMFLEQVLGDDFVSKFNYLGYGTMGVDVFFVLSGFLMFTLTSQERARNEWSPVRFWKRRLARILPAAWVYLFLAAVLMLAGVLVPEWKEWLGALTFTRDYVPFNPPHEPSVTHFWSLSVELQFYLLWPLLLFIAIPRNRMLACVAICIGFAVWRYASFRLPHTVWHTYGYWSFDLRADNLFWGCVAGWICMQYRSAPFWKKVPGSGVVLLLLAFIILATEFSIRLQNSFVWMAMGLLFVVTVSCPKSLVSSLLSHASLDYLGRISYSLYIWQQLFLLTGFIPHGILPVIPDLLLRLSLSIATAHLSYTWIEIPGRRWLVGRFIPTPSLVRVPT